MKEYTYAKNPTAPRQTFICPNCGAEVIRRLSKVKNMSLVFCDNTCRARYNEKLLLARKNLELDDKTMKNELKEMNKIIKWSVLDMANRFGRFDDMDDLEQIARISIWKNYKEAHNGQGKPESYYISCIKKSIMNGLFRKEPFEQLDDFVDFPDTENPEANAMQKEIIGNLYSKKTRSYKMLLKSALEGATHEEIARRFGCTIRDVSANIYNAKRLIGVTL